MPKTKTFTLYLAKSDLSKFEDVFTPTAADRIAGGNVTIRESATLGNRARAFIFDNVPRQPKWLPDLRGAFDDVPNLTNKSSCAVIVFECARRTFVTPFAHGWQYIDEAKIEMDFGLKVVINSLSDEKIKRIDRSHLGEAMKGVSQSAFQRALEAFGIDEALDLVRRISGRTANDDFADSLAGATALKVSRAMNVQDLAEVAEEALTRFQSDAYKQTRFQIIDKVKPILDQTLLTRLDEEAVNIIKTGGDNFELSMPGWSEDDIVYYGFSGLGVRGRFPDLLMENYRTALLVDTAALDVESIESKHAVFAEFANESLPDQRWSIKKALIGSVVFEEGLYAVSEGEWYRLDQQFKSDVDGSFRELLRDWSAAPLKIIKKISGKKTGFESELEYNKRCADFYGQICLDQEILQVPSIPYGKFEACDLLDIGNKRLIHVKKSSRQSSVLSHFFKQGGNSARLLKTYPEAREALIKKVYETAGEASATLLKEGLGHSLSDWIVEFHIVDAPRPDGTFAIPFFSRITLRDEARNLKGMTFGVALRFVPT